MSVTFPNGDYYEDQFDMMTADDSGQNKPLGPVISSLNSEQSQGLRLAQSTKNVPNEQEPKHAGFYLIRHGSTDMNAEGGKNSADTIRGWSNVPLNDKGRQEVSDTATELKDKGITAIVSSDLDRAQETARIIGKEIGVEPSFSMKLRPWDLGQFTGKPAADSAPALREHSMEKPDEPVPGGESFNEFKGRTLEGIKEAFLQHPNDNLAIVAHHRTDRLLNSLVEGEGEVHEPTFLSKGEAPGSYQQMSRSDIESMTHQAEQPNPARPYIDIANQFFHGGVSEVLGEHQPEWSQKLGKALSSPEASAALGVLGLGPIASKGKETYEQVLNYFNKIGEMEKLTPLERANALGFTTDAYRGIRKPYDPNYSSGYSAVYMTGHPELAEMYAGRLDLPAAGGKTKEIYPEGANVLPLRLNTRDYHEVDAKGAMWADSNITMEAVNEAVEQGKKGVIIRNIYDEPSGNTDFLGAPKDVYIPLDKKTVRSRFAQFDPSKLHLEDWLASVGGVSLAAGSLIKDFGNEDKSAVDKIMGAVAAAGAIPSSRMLGNTRGPRTLGSGDWNRTSIGSGRRSSLSSKDMQDIINAFDQHRSVPVTDVTKPPSVKDIHKELSKLYGVSPATINRITSNSDLIVKRFKQEMSDKFNKMFGYREE